jgi:hypothetical protein
MQPGVETLTFWEKISSSINEFAPMIPKSFFSTASEVTKFKILMNVSSATTVSGLRMQIYSLLALRRYYFLLKTNIIRMSLTFGKRFSIIAQLSSGELLSITMISPSMVSNAF